MSRNKKGYTLGEEIASSITHGIGAIFGITALTLLVVFASFFGNAWHIVSFSIFGACLIIMYTMSTLYHAFVPEKLKNIFQIFDHSSIYLLIAGTYTPFCLVSLNGAIGWSLFGIIWGICAIGIVIEAVGFRGSKMLSSIVYMAMGWLIIIFIKDLLLCLSIYSLVWLVAGGIFYSLGVIFYVIKKMPYHHAVWHVFVLFGSICHSISIFYII